MYIDSDNFLWILDPANPAGAATWGDNTRDNVEAVLIDAPTPGCYTFQVTHKGTLTNGPQDFALILSGTTPPDEPCPADLDGDGSVGISDLLALLAAWGTDPGGPPDLDDDGTVGINDLLILLGSWGPCP